MFALTACYITLPQVEEGTVRSFVDMAAAEHAPRFIRFLREVMRPGGKAIKRNQLLVLGCLNDKEAALLLYSDPEGRRRRDELIAAADHVTHPRGELMYHIELVGLLGEAGLGDNASAELQVCVPRPLGEKRAPCSLLQWYGSERVCDVEPT